MESRSQMKCLVFIQQLILLLTVLLAVTSHGCYVASNVREVILGRHGQKTFGCQADGACSARHFILYPDKNTKVKDVSKIGGVDTNGRSFCRMTHHIMNADPAKHNGTWTCGKIPNDLCHIDVKVLVQPPIPTIRRRGDNSQGIVAQDSIGLDNEKLVCQVEGDHVTQPVTYIWRKLHGDDEFLSDHDIKESNGMSVLTIKSLRRKDAGQIVCEARNVAGQETSLPFNITVTFQSSEKPTIYEDPSHITLKGKKKSISCTSGSCFPQCEFAWYWSKGGSQPLKISDNPKYTIEDDYKGDYRGMKTTSTLSFTATENEDENMYECRMKYNRNYATYGSTVLKNSLTLDVHTPPSLLLMSDPSEKVREGESVKLTCKVTSGRAKDQSSFTWHGPKGSESITVNAKGEELIISQIEPENDGLYWCSVVDERGAEGESSRIKLTVSYGESEPEMSLPSSILGFDMEDNMKTFVSTIVVSVTGLIILVIIIVVSYKKCKSRPPGAGLKHLGVDRHNVDPLNGQPKFVDVGNPYVCEIDKEEHIYEEPGNIQNPYSNNPRVGAGQVEWSASYMPMAHPSTSGRPPSQPQTRW